MQNDELYDATLSDLRKQCDEALKENLDLHKRLKQCDEQIRLDGIALNAQGERIKELTEQLADVAATHARIENFADAVTRIEAKVDTIGWKQSQEYRAKYGVTVP